MDTSELDNSNCYKLGGGVKQVDEKHAASDIREMIWSPKMDLVAAITLADPSEVILYRLHALKKLWTHPPPCEGAKVVSVAWDPMGTCIAVAYTNSQVLILAVEKAAILYTHDLSSVPTRMSWLSVEDDDKGENLPFFKDMSEKMLPKLPSVNRENHPEPSVKLINQEVLNYLVVSGDSGLINVYVYGLLSIASIDLQNLCFAEVKTCSSCLSSSGSHIVCVAKDKHGDYHLTALVTQALSTRREEIQTIADKFVKLISLLEHCDASITKMTEAWEDGLLELDSKLNHFSTQKQLIGDGTVLNDFLELLLFGTPSDELKIFLTKDLTERGMKKLGTSLQAYYKTMQELLTINMQSAVESIFYHLNDLYGLSQWTDTFGAIGLNTEHRVEEAIQCCGSLRLKINEMQELLSTGNRNLKSFSAWLYAVILRVSEQTVPDTYATPDYYNVADFLNENFGGLEENGSHIRLERVGQYLKDCDLTCPPKLDESSLWTTLEDYPNLSDSKLIYKAQPDMSLIQLYKQLSTLLRDALTTPSVSIAKSMVMKTTIKLSQGSKLHKVKQFPVTHGDGIQYIYNVYSLEREGDNSQLQLFVTKLSLQEGRRSVICGTELRFGQLGQHDALYSCSQHRVVDFDYYKNEEIAVLLQQMEGNGSHLYVSTRLNLANLTAEDWLDNWSCESQGHAVDAGKYVNISYVEILQNASKAIQISVSGKRDIGSVMLSNRRVRLFMYDGDDDSDEEEESMSQEASMTIDDPTNDKENVNTH